MMTRTGLAIDWTQYQVDASILPLPLRPGCEYLGELLGPSGYGTFLRFASGKIVPANAPLLDLIATRFAHLGTRWKVKGVPGNLRVHWSKEPTWHGHPLRLDVLAVIPVEEVDQSQPVARSRLQDILDLGAPGEALIATFRAMKTARFPRQIGTAVADWLRRAIAGEPSSIFAAVCPDYAVDGLGRYTFEDLQSGVGLVAQRILRSLNPLSDYCQGHGLPVTFVIAIGDFEADNEVTCRKMGITRDEFLERLRASQEAFRSAAPAGLRLETPFATELGDWHGTLALARTEAAQGRMTGAFSISDDDLAEICEARGSLYRRWFGEDVDVRQVLMAQAPEYMTLGTLAATACPNPLILGGDSPAMAAFWQGLGDTVRPAISTGIQAAGNGVRPVVYLEKVDY